jgi:hypothetical protein
MKESMFNYEVVRSLKKLGCWAYKIPDFPQSMVVGARFNPEKPCDIVAFVGKMGIGIEGKMIRKYESFGSRNLRPSQIKNMDEMEDRDDSAGAFIFLNVRQVSPRLNRLIIFRWGDWRWKLREGMIHKEELMNFSYIEGKGGLFPLRDFVDMVGRENTEVDI